VKDGSIHVPSLTDDGATMRPREVRGDKYPGSDLISW
jgi:hypothetical protein